MLNIKTLDKHFDSCWDNGKWWKQVLWLDTKSLSGFVSLKSLVAHRELVLTRAVDRRRMDKRVRAEVKVVSLLTLASFLIST